MHRRLYIAVSLLLILNSPIAFGSYKSGGNEVPMAFTENLGQITDQYCHPRNDIRFRLSAKGATVFIGNGQLHYQFYKAGGSDFKKISNDAHMPSISTIHRLDVQLLGANEKALVIAEEKQVYAEHYYLTYCYGKTAGSYSKITYKEIYPNIDWTLYIKDGKLEYDFIVHPGGKVENIRIRYTGATDITKNMDGTISARTPFGIITENKPISFIKSTRKAILSSFTLQGNTLSFNVPDQSETFIIDPVLDWSTYYGGADQEGVQALAADNSGNVYLTGHSSSLNNIATIGSYQYTYSDTGDGFVAKLNAAGQRVWGTYFGGPSNDQFYDATVDALGNIILAGATNTAMGIATVGAHQVIMAGINDAILVKFNPLGQLQWATYYGGNGTEYGHGVAVDIDNNIYLTGNTNSSNNISTPGSFQFVPPSQQNAFIAKFNSSGQRIWGTYFGGSSYDFCTNITYDSFSNHIYITGFTSSTNTYATLGAHQTINLGQSAFLEKIDTSGQQVWGTYYGGGNTDRGEGVCTDTQGNVYITGSTQSFTNIASSNAYQTAIGNLQNIDDCFLVKFNTTGQRLWGTYYGGDDLDISNEVICDDENNVYISGYTNSSTMTSTPGSYQPIPNVFTDGFIAKFNPEGQRLYATFFGGESGDYIYSMCRGVNNSLYVGGHTFSLTGIATTGAAQTTHAGAYDGFVAKFNDDTTVVINQYFTDTILCQGGVIIVDYSTSGSFQNGNTFTLQLSDAVGSFATPINIGSTSSTVSGVINGVIPITTPPGAGYRIRIVSSNVSYTSYDNGIDIEVKEIPATPTLSSNSPVCAGTPINLTAFSTTTGTSYSWSGPNSFTSSTQNPTLSNATVLMSGEYIATATLNGCTSEPDTISVTVNPSSAAAVNITANPGTSINIGQSVTFTANVTNGSTPTYQWRLNGADIIGETNATYTSTTLANNDIVSVMVHASGTCLIPDSALSNQLTMSVTNNVSQIDKHSQLSLYPNPNKGIFMIEGPFSTDMPNIDAISIIGETIPVTYSRTNDNIVKVSVNNIKSGNYIVRVKLSDKVTYLMITITD